MKSVCVLSIMCSRKKFPKTQLNRVFAFNVVENPVIQDANLVSCFSNNDKRGFTLWLCILYIKQKDQIKCDAEASECVVQGAIGHSCTMNCMLMCFLLAFIAYYLLLCHYPILPVVERDCVVVEAEDSHPCLVDCTLYTAFYSIYCTS